MRTSRHVLSLVLAVMLVGGHIAALQVVAWGGMLVDRIPTRGWSAAVDSTLSGADPCQLCTAITAASVEKSDPGAPAPSVKQVKKVDALMIGWSYPSGVVAAAEWAWPGTGMCPVTGWPLPDVPPPII